MVAKNPLHSLIRCCGLAATFFEPLQLAQLYETWRQINRNQFEIGPISVDDQGSPKNRKAAPGLESRVEAARLFCYNSAESIAKQVMK